MPSAQMNLNVLLPHKVFARQDRVVRIVAVTPDGAFGILPHRLDCVASLSAGILVYQIADDDETCIAVDEGVLVKSGFDVLVSVRNATGGMALSQLRQAVEQEFMHLDEHEQRLRSVLAKMENGFIQRLATFNQDKTLS